MAVTVMFELQVKTSAGGGAGAVTVIVNEQLLKSPQLSEAVQVTVVMPRGKVLPLGGVHQSDGGGLQPPLAVLV